MEENELIVLIVNDENAAESYKTDIKQEIVDEYGSDNSIEDTNHADHDSKSSNIKCSYKTHEYDVEIKEVCVEFVGDCSDDGSYTEIDYVEQNNKGRPNSKKIKDYKSYVHKLKEENPEYVEDTEKLILKLAEIMKNIKPPKPPIGFYREHNFQYQCKICSTLTDTLGAIERHFITTHGPRYLICYACGDDFRRTRSLYKHEQRCKAPDATYVVKARAIAKRPRAMRRKLFLPKMPKIKKETNEKFSCSLCSAVFKCKSGLKAHDRLHRGERPFICHMCGASYTTGSSLSRHLESHKETKLICDICKREFKMKTSLVSHMDTHLPTKKYKCKFEGCKQSFTQKYAIDIHMNCFHLKKPLPCACTICPKRYPKMSLLKVHMKQKHGMTLLTRNMLYKTLPQMSESQIVNAKVVFTEDLSANNYKIFTDEETPKVTK